MTPEEFAAKMRVIAGDNPDNPDDPEIAHLDADALMCDVLTQLGYGDGVNIFAAMLKWYV